jgi:hypothetical protein
MATERVIFNRTAVGHVRPIRPDDADARVVFHDSLRRRHTSRNTSSMHWLSASGEPQLDHVGPPQPHLPPQMRRAHLGVDDA